MTKFKKYLPIIVFSLSIISFISIVFNIFAIYLYQDEIFIYRDTFSSVEFFMIIGFSIIALFTIVSIFWLIIDSINNSRFEWADSFIILFGIISFIILFAEKVMFDEIGREMRLGWETIGEMIILNLLMTCQLVYIIIFTRRLKITLLL